MDKELIERLPELARQACGEMRLTGAVLFGADELRTFAALVEAEILARIDAERGKEAVSCQHCDGTGDVHSIDGEWRGECNCGAAQYNMIDRFLRNNLDDADYAEYSSALDTVAAIPECMALWDSGAALQIDSYATGRPQAGVAHLMADCIYLEVTDGISTFRGKIPLPVNWGLTITQGEQK